MKIITPAEAAELARISETGKRVIDYYIERMPIEDVIIRMNELIREKEAQLQTMLRLVHSERCIREEILGFFGEEMWNETEVLLFGLWNCWMVYLA